MSKKKTFTDLDEDVPAPDTSSLDLGEAPPESPPPLPDTPPPLPNGAGEQPRAAPAAPSNHDLSLFAASVPVAQPAPPAAPDPALEERLRRLEALLTQAQQNLQTAQQQRITERTQTLETPPPTGPTVFGQARALFEIGRHLLPAMPPGQTQARPRGWLLWELIAELRAMACMYLDPRYRVSWWGYVLPPALFLAFLFTKYWFPFALVLEKANLAWIVVVPADLLLLYVMFKILGYEARRYRETAPDLPPSLRL